jgi:hypothetical protein
MGRTVFFLLGLDVTSPAVASAAVKTTAAAAIGKTNAAVTAGRAFDSREYRPCRDFTDASLAITSMYKQGRKATEPEIL